MAGFAESVLPPFYLLQSIRGCRSAIMTSFEVPRCPHPKEESLGTPPYPDRHMNDYSATVSDSLSIDFAQWVGISA